MRVDLWVEIALKFPTLKIRNKGRIGPPPLRFLQPGVIAGCMPRARQTLGTSTRRIGPYSRVFDRTLKGGISLDGRTVEGKFSNQFGGRSSPIWGAKTSSLRLFSN